MFRFYLLLISIVVGVLSLTARDNPLELPSCSPVMDGYERDIVEARLRDEALHPVEGLWRFPGEGSVMAVERIDVPRPAGETVDVYRMVAVSPADRAVRPGTLMGILVATARKNVYDCRLYTSATDDGKQLRVPKKFLIILAEDGVRLSFRPYGKKIKFRWWRLFPYMFSRFVTVVDEQPEGLDGCVRVFPEPMPPLQPRYL